MLGLFSGELIFGGGYYWKEFCVTKWVALDNKNRLKLYENSLKQLKTASTNSPWAYIRKCLFSIGRIFASEFWGTYFREDLFIYLFIYLYYFFLGGGLTIGILRYFFKKSGWLIFMYYVRESRYDTEKQQINVDFDRSNVLRKTVAYSVLVGW